MTNIWLGMCDESDRLAKLSSLGDGLERLDAAVDWEAFRPALARAVPRKDSGRGGQPPYDHSPMFKAVVLQRMYNLSDEQAEYQINDRRSFGRFLGLGPGNRVPDAKTIWLFEDSPARATPARRTSGSRRASRSGSCEKGARSRPPDEAQKASNGEKPRVRCRVEYVFGFMTNSMGGIASREVGLARNSFAIGITNLVYNLCRYGFLQRQGGRGVAGGSKGISPGLGGKARPGVAAYRALTPGRVFRRRDSPQHHLKPIMGLLLEVPASVSVRGFRCRQCR